MRVTTAFNRLLRLPGAAVIDVSFGGEGVIVTVRLRRRRRVCSVCGQTGRRLEIHDHRIKRWRHLDLGASRCVMECSLRRLRCPDCGVHLEAVAWARANAQHTRDFEDVVAWLAQQMAKTPITSLLRIGWDTVGRIVERVVADHLDERRLEGLVAIGVDEISYRRGQRYLTTVADHAKGAIVWCAPGRNAQTLQAFFDLLGERRGSIRAVSIDMSGGYEKAIRENVPDAEIAFDPFHVVRLAQRAVDLVAAVLDGLGLRLDPEKTRIAHLARGAEGFTFLGFEHRMRESWRQPGRWYLQEWPSRRAMASIRGKIRARTDRRYASLPLEWAVEDLNRVLRGWGNYFRYGNSGRKFSQIDGYVNERLAILASAKHGLQGRNWTTRFTYEWVSQLGIYRLDGTVKPTLAYASR